MKNLYVFLFVMTALVSCGTNKEENNTDSVTVAGDTVYVQDATILSRISTTKISSEPWSMDFTASCKVKAMPDKFATIASPFAGRIVKSFVTLGQKVGKGSPVFAISSASFSEASALYRQTQQEVKLAKQKYERTRDLVENKVGAQRDLEEAEAEYLVAQSAAKSAEASLKAFNSGAEAVSSDQPLIVRSPIAGDVVKSDIVIGQYVKEDSEALVTVVNSDKVWAVANVKEKDIRYLNSLDNAEIQLIAYPDRVFKGRVFNIGELLNEDTQSVEVVVECDNADHLMKPAMYGSMLLADSVVNTISVPTTAIMQAEDNTYVLVHTGSNAFVRRTISTGESRDGKTVVNSGLLEGETIVVSGAFLIGKK